MWRDDGRDDDGGVDRGARHRLKLEDVDLRICWAQCYLIIRQERYEDAAAALREIKEGFRAIGEDHAAAEVALDEAFVLAMAAKWAKSDQALEEAAQSVHVEQMRPVVEAITARKLEHFGASHTSLSQSSPQEESPVLVAAGLHGAKATS